MSFAFLLCNGRKERKMAKSALHTIFQSSLQSSNFFFTTFRLCSCGGDLSALLPVLLSEPDNYACNCLYFQLSALLPVLLSESDNYACNCLYFQLTARSPRQTITVIQQVIDVKTSSLRNGGESEKETLFTFSASNDLSNNLF
jgi:hypothetical protein